MSEKREVVALSAVRSAVGTFGGTLSSMEPCELGGLVIKEAILRSGVDPKQVTFAAVGNVIPTEVRYPYVARVASIQGGMTMDSVALAVNRLCGSAQQAVVNSAQAILLGDADFAIGGGQFNREFATRTRRHRRFGVADGDSNMRIGDANTRDAVEERAGDSDPIGADFADFAELQK